MAPKSSSSKGHGSSKSHGSSKGHGKSSSSKEKTVYFEVWYCDACNYGPWNPATDADCLNCGHRRCGTCTSNVIAQGPKQ
ncbi:uncharacterized protein ColSpa_06243 [Colletotrichum spaethianum]|uniref:Uncharacterized protein n=1 Tax=Colletotrichum spaethianum TaxID=700344 RepID=A0AA37LKM4_9PEZI|nr:uncharacterized protein ColSpa_06243 [Colletotrichum spaethianum]GKT46062.1 hypothetical protein ColSpa_06243 [Colletotrichum spaethianum]